MLLQLSHFPPHSTPSCPPPPSHIPPYSSCPWVINISSLASTFPTPFLPSPCLFCTYHLRFLFSVPFPPFFPLRLHTDNPPCNLRFCDSVPLLVVCLVHFCFWFCFLSWFVDSCKFVVIFTVHIFYLLFLR